LTTAGHEVLACFSTDDAGSDTFGTLLEDELQDADAVLVAGGDGSVRRIALGLINRNVPIGVLPMGTANNIARTLKLPRDPLRVIQELEAMVPARRDVGHFVAPWGTGHFVEGAGFGPFSGRPFSSRIRARRSPSTIHTRS
jgi:diacylglycerol kinase family enzyme